MTLGQKINQLRTQKNLSQGDLADMLDVSRQSISKWETDGSVPDLDNLIKLSQIFNVTLDELVLNKSASTASPQGEAPEHSEGPSPEPIIIRSGTPPRIIIGAVLLICSFLGILICTVLGDPVAGMVLMLPLMFGSLICFTVKKHTGLVFFWISSILVDIFLRWSTGINFRLTRIIFRPELMANGITIQLIIAIIETIWLWALILFTIHRFHRGSAPSSKKLILSWILGLFLCFILGYSLKSIIPFVIDRAFDAAFYLSLQCIFDWGQIVLVTYLWILSMRWYREYRSLK